MQTKLSDTRNQSIIYIAGEIQGFFWAGGTQNWSGGSKSVVEGLKRSYNNERPSQLTWLGLDGYSVIYREQVKDDEKL